jgi:hypothetical protein
MFEIRREKGPRMQGISIHMSGDNAPHYPKSWEMGLSELRKEVDFPVLLPDRPDASKDSLMSSYLIGRKAVVLAFRPPEDAPTVRQDYIEIYMNPWDDGDPRAEFEHAQNVDPIEGREVIEIDGRPAMVVHPNSETDTDIANAAYLETVVEDIELEVSGGDDLNRLIQITEDLMAQSEKRQGAKSHRQVSPGQRRVARECRDQDVLVGLLDADNKRDFAYHDWMKSGARLGVCTSKGSHDRIEGAGQTELLALADLNMDGRKEILYGATTMRGQLYLVAVVRKGQLERVTYDGEPVGLVEGIDEGLVSKRRNAGAAFSCGKQVAADARGFKQAVVFRRAQGFRWIRKSYRLDGRIAMRMDKDAGHFENNPNKNDLNEVVELAHDLVGRCRMAER